MTYANVDLVPLMRIHLEVSGSLLRMENNVLLKGGSDWIAKLVWR